jgi:hypothetical protein
MLLCLVMIPQAAAQDPPDPPATGEPADEGAAPASGEPSVEVVAPPVETPPPAPTPTPAPAAPAPSAATPVLVRVQPATGQTRVVAARPVRDPQELPAYREALYLRIGGSVGALPEGELDAFGDFRGLGWTQLELGWHFPGVVSVGAEVERSALDGDPWQDVSLDMRLWGAGVRTRFTWEPLPWVHPYVSVVTGMRHARVEATSWASPLVERSVALRGAALGGVALVRPADIASFGAYLEMGYGGQTNWTFDRLGEVRRWGMEGGGGLWVAMHPGALRRR